MRSVWRRQKRILCPPSEHEWWGKLAQMPTVLKIDPHRWRIFFAARSHQNIARIIYIDVNPLNEMEIIAEFFSPQISLGETGSFDCDGMGATCFYEIDGKLHLCYTGLQLGKTIFQASIGTLTYDIECGNLNRHHTGPILSTGPYDPSSVVAAQIKKIGELYHMWYASTQFWILDAEPTPEACYNIKHATSADGIHWQSEEKPSIDFKSDQEGGITKPWVSSNPNENGYEMWFCYRGRYSLEHPKHRAYKIGYATSPDLINWARKDEEHQFSNPAQKGDWDFEMQCYPCIVESEGKSYMFYCGNDYSNAGFGYAVRES